MMAEEVPPNKPRIWVGSAQKEMEAIFRSAGVAINGDDPWDIQVHNTDFYRRILTHGSLGFGESHMDEWWSCEALDQLMARILSRDLEAKIKSNIKLICYILSRRLFNYQGIQNAKQVGRHHYDIGNQLFTRMLDSRMCYSCAYWQDSTTLEQAQLNKLDLICRKLRLEPGQTLLDIGCGWGGLARYAAEQYGVQVVGITISKQQCEYAQNYCKGLPIEIRLQDYRHIDQQFDRIVSVGMFEHVGYKNHATYMKILHQCLVDDGLFLLHTIGSNEQTTHADPWINKYIFPNGMLPSPQQISAAIEGLFVLEDWHNFGHDYDATLMAWHERFVRVWPEISDQYDDRFFRMWTYYLLSCAGGFRVRAMQLWQLVLSKKGVIGGYRAPR